MRYNLRICMASCHYLLLIITYYSRDEGYIASAIPSVLTLLTLARAQCAFVLQCGVSNEERMICPKSSSSAAASSV